MFFILYKQSLKKLFYNPYLLHWQPEYTFPGVKCLCDSVKFQRTELHSTEMSKLSWQWIKIMKAE